MARDETGRRARDRRGASGLTRARLAAVAVVLALVTSLVPLTLSSASASASANTLPAATRTKLNALVAQFRSITKAPGVLAGVWSPQGTWTDADGLADLATKAPVALNQQFRIGSQTKTFVATLILQLVGQGTVKLSDPIGKWVPNVPNGATITIRQLLTHTSGLGDVFSAPSVQAKVAHTGCTESDLLTGGAAVPPAAQPGALFLYSNYGYDLLGRVAEEATGDDLSDLITRRITKPLHLTRTGLPVAGNGLTSPYMHGYAADPTEAPTAQDDATSVPASCLWAAGGMVSTLADMHKWSVALATGALLKPRVWKEAEAARVAVSFPALSPGTLSWGLGFIRTGGFIGHQGGIPGYETATFYSPRLHTTVEFVSNKQFNAIPATTMAQELAMAAAGHRLGFGITPAQGMRPLTVYQLAGES